LTKNTKISHWTIAVTLALVLLIGAYFRFVEIQWDATYHLHPDERFLTMVSSSIRPVSNYEEFLNTSISSLNPHNVLDTNGNQTYPFFVYGTFPLFLVRYIAEWTNQAGYGDIHIIGRYLSGAFDIGTIFLVFLISRELFKKRWIPLFTAFLYACAVLPIQISHFYIVDNFATFFSVLAIYFSHKLINQEIPINKEKESQQIWTKLLKEWRGFEYFALFGIAVGLAASSKINSIVISILLPIAALIKHPIIFNKSKDSAKTFIIFRNLLGAGVISIFVFRFFQPYAFSGPGFFDLSLNQNWLRNLKELAYLSSGSSNYPPSLQWARRSFFFPIKNLVVWGLGIPMGITALFGVVVMSWKIIRNERKGFLLILVWNLINLIWQMSRWNPTMRYLLLAYPTLVISSVWFINFIIEKLKAGIKSRILEKSLSVFLLIIIVLGSFLWGIAFTNTYRQPMTRIEASEWMYQNIAGPVNLILQDGDKRVIQAIPYPHQNRLNAGEQLEFLFQSDISGIVNKIIFDEIIGNSETNDFESLFVQVINTNSGKILIEAKLSDFNHNESGYIINAQDFDQFESFPISSDDKVLFRLKNSSETGYYLLRGNISFGVNQKDTEFDKAIFKFSSAIRDGQEIDLSFTPRTMGELKAVELFRVKDSRIGEALGEIQIEIFDESDNKSVGIGIGNLEESGDLDYRGKNISIELNEGLFLEEDKSYRVKVRYSSGFGNSILITGSSLAKETDWDDALPLLMFGMNPHDSYQGVYQSTLNFQMYWDDNTDKRKRFISILDQADYIVMTSNRQWGSVTQIPERFPLTNHFYKELLGCDEDDIQRCYAVGSPGSYEEHLGFQLIKTFQSNPKVLGMEFNSQFAEEAFTVYDHPKVLIFKKQTDFNIEQVINVLNEINLEEVINLSPAEADKHAGKLLLTEARFQKQKESGTWAELFDFESKINSTPFLTVFSWYLVISLMGWVVYPLTRIVFSGLPDKGFSVAKIFGLILIAYPVWILSSIGLEFSRLLIIVILIGIVIVNTFILFKKKKIIAKEITSNLKTFVWMEILSLIFFLLFLTTRVGNPDLWHPYKGGEKPMDFAYFNAVLKSIQFPPYDPWYAGGYINYYYFGFVLAAIPTKLLGVIPSISYNLILPTFFLFTAMGAYAIGLTFFDSREKNQQKKFKRDKFKLQFGSTRILALIVPVFVLLIGNLGTIQMLLQGLQKIGSIDSNFSPGNLFSKLTDLIRGVGLFFQGRNLNYYPGDWYWIPSRSIPGEAITEFPLFTFLYGDPHAHLFAYPITLLSLNWMINLIFEERKRTKKELIVTLLFGAIIVGCLRPTNTWDYPTMLALACVSLIYYLLFVEEDDLKNFRHQRLPRKKIFTIFFLSVGFAVFSFILYLPFSKWYGQAYASVQIWEGSKTPIWAYFTHWGFFIFIAVSWLIKEIYILLDQTPLSAIQQLYKKRLALYCLLATVIAISALLYIWGVTTIVILAPILLTGLIIVFGRNTSPKLRVATLMMVVGFTLTLIVEIIVLKGDIGRMNTVFKFYLQSWTFLSVSSGIFLVDIYQGKQKVKIFIKNKIWNWCFAFLLISVFLFPVLGGMDKITDRIGIDSPHSLDGMGYMNYSVYVENNLPMELGQDYTVIRWMQDNIKGTPVILEANVPEYRFGNRYSIYTGLPSVIGWNWHQRQQRAINPGDWVFNRIDDVNQFYNTPKMEEAAEVLKKYDVKYFVVGQLEHAVYDAPGIKKFGDSETDIWAPIYRYKDTTVYEVIREVY